MTSAILPDGEPSVVPGGLYLASVRGEVSEQISKFDVNKKYFILPLFLSNEAGETFDFVWAFGPKNPSYMRFLEIIGGVTQKSGKVTPPLEYEGKTFVIKIGEQLSKDKSHPVNSVIAVFPDNRTTGKGKIPGTDDVPF